MTSTNSQEDGDVTYCKSSEKHGNKRLVRYNSIGLSGEKKRKFLKEFLENLPEIMRDEVLAEMMRDEEEKMLKDTKEKYSNTNNDSNIGKDNNDRNDIVDNDKRNYRIDNHNRNGIENNNKIGRAHV